MTKQFLTNRLRPFNARFFLNNHTVLAFWLLITLIFVIDSWITHRLNNYLIFENTFRNLVHQKSLFAAYPAYHDDANHYGPLFGALIMPFAILPNTIGLLLWNLFNCMILFKAIQTLPLSDDKKAIIGYIAIPCLIESMLNQQFNAAAGALMILSYTQLNKQNGFWATMCIMLGAFVKLYGIVGLIFFFFSKKKPAFIAGLIFWSVVFFLLPMLFSSPQYIAHSYVEWKSSLIEKNISNILGAATDISIMGFFRVLLDYPELSNSMFIAFGSLLFMLPFRRPEYFSKHKFQLLVLGSVLLFPVLFSTGAEDCTYIIAIPAVGIWYVLDKNKGLKNALLPILLVVCCNFPLLLFPVFAKSHPLCLSVLSLPYFLVWLRIIYITVVHKKQHLFETEPEWVGSSS